MRGEKEIMESKENSVGPKKKEYLVGMREKKISEIVVVNEYFYIDHINGEFIYIFQSSYSSDKWSNGFIQANICKYNIVQFLILHGEVMSMYIYI